MTRGGWCALVCLFVSCKSETKPAEKLPFEGVEVTISLPKGIDVRKRWRPILDEWSAQTGATVAFAEDGDVRFVPLIRFADDLVSSPPGEMSSELAKTVKWREQFRGLREAMGRFETRPAILPVAIRSLVCYYRADLLQTAGKKPPRTWQEYDQLVRRIGEWAPGHTFAEPWAEDWCVTTFLSRAASYARGPGSFSFCFHFETGDPLINTAGFARAWGDVQRSFAGLDKPQIDRLASATPADCRRELLSGKAAIGLTFEQPGETAAPRAKDVKLGFVRLPGAEEYFDVSRKEWKEARGGNNQMTLVAPPGMVAWVAGKTRNPEAAWDLIRTLLRIGGDDGDSPLPEFPAGWRSPTRPAHASAARAFTGKELSSAEAKSFVSQATAALDESPVVLELPVPNRRIFRKALSDELAKSLRQPQKPEQHLSHVAKEWEAQIKTVGRDKFRDAYRRALGLLPASKIGAN